MISNGIKASPEQCILLLDELQNSLNQHLKLMNKGDFGASEEITEETGKLVDELSQIDVSQDAKFRERFAYLVKSYRKIILSVAAEKHRIEKQLDQIRQGRKTLKTYGGLGTKQK